MNFYFEKMRNDCNTDLKGADEGNLGFLPMPQGFITCTCSKALKAIEKLIETGTIKDIKVESHTCEQSGSVLEGWWRQVVTDDKDDNGKGQVVLFEGPAASVKVAEKRYDSRDMSDLDDDGGTIDGEDPGLGMDNVMTELYNDGFDFGYSNQLDAGSKVKYNGMRLLTRGAAPMKAHMFSRAS